MQRRYVAIGGFVSIPSTSGKYAISLEGNVRDERNRILPAIKKEDGHSYIYADLWNGHNEYPVALLMAFAFKPHHLPEKFWPLLSVEFVDGDSSNVHPSNLVWMYPPGGIECEFKSGYKYIPGFTKYVIDSNGVLFCIKNNMVRTPIKSSNGYTVYKLRPDVGLQRYTTGRHRLVGLAWLKYPANVDQLQINHIDTIPGNDWLGNLEWATQVQNMQHAKQHELLTICKPTLVRKARTGEVVRYPSLLDAAADIGVAGNSLRNRLKQEGQPLYPGDLQFKFEDDPTPWRDVPEDEVYSRRGTPPVTLKAFDIASGIVTVYKGIKAAAVELGLDTARIWHCLNTPRLYNREVKGYVFHLASDESPWPV